MSYPFFFISPENISDTQIIINGDDHRHLIKVLRAKINEKIEVSDNKTYKYTAEIVQINKDNSHLRIIEKRKIIPETTLITLFQSLLKRTSMELVIQKASELGIYEIFPVKSVRVVAEDRNFEEKIKRWEKIAKEASKQSKRDYLPKIHKKILINDIKPADFDLLYLCYEELKKESFKKINIVNDLKSYIKNRKDVTGQLKIGFMVGPEGGFEKKEIEMLTLKGARPISLGNNILKAETAAIALSSIIRYSADVFT